LLRSVKYGLYGAVLAGVVAGTSAWHTTDKTVALVVDGQRISVHTTAARVGDLLSDRKLTVTSHDIVAPPVTAALHSGSEVVVRKGRELRLDVNGQLTDIWTTASTVDEAMSQLGYSTADFTSVSRSRRLPLSPTDLTIRTPQVVTVVINGRPEQVSTTDGNVGSLLADMGVQLAPLDRVSPSPTSAIVGHRVVRVDRVLHRQLVVSAPIPFAITTTKVPTMLAGTTQVIRPGKAGLAKITYDVVYLNGKIVGKTPIGKQIVRRPVPQQQRIGTAPVVVGAPPPNTNMAASAQKIGRTLIAQRGWASQWGCLVNLWDNESGWRWNAGNNSGAYGIPQALPGYKMASAGADWQTNPATQIKWGLNYIKATYGSPCGAWSHWQSAHWY
jgi:uncharacterized protein YabE (DUF348 family)